MEVTRVCSGCETSKTKAEYSKNQYKKGVGSSRCKACVVSAEAQADQSESTNRPRGLSTASSQSAESSASRSSMGGSLYDQLSRKGNVATSHGMSLAEFESSLAMADDLGLNSQGLEVGTDEWKRWAKALFNRLDVNGSGRVSRQGFIKCFDEVDATGDDESSGDFAEPVSDAAAETDSPRMTAALEEATPAVVDLLRERLRKEADEEDHLRQTIQHQQSELEVAQREIDRLHASLRSLATDSDAKIELYRSELNKIRSEVTVAKFKERVRLAIESRNDSEAAQKYIEEIRDLEHALEAERSARAILVSQVEQHERDRLAQNKELARRDSQLGSLRAEVEELHDKYENDIARLKHQHEIDVQASVEKQDAELAAAVALAAAATPVNADVGTNTTKQTSTNGREINAKREAESQLTLVDLRDKLSMYRARLQANSRQHAREMQMLAREADSVAMENKNLRGRLDRVAGLIRGLPALVREAELSGEMCERNMAIVYEIAQSRRRSSPSPLSILSSPRSPLSPEQFAALERDTHEAQRSLEHVVAMHLS